MKRNFEFKGKKYTFSKLMKMYLDGEDNGEVCNLDTGEVWNISDIMVRAQDNMITNTEKSRIVNRKSSSYLEKKYNEGNITKDELYSLLKLKNQHNITPNYNYDDGYIIVNLNMIPTEVSDSDFGKFNKMLYYLSGNHFNKVMSSEGSRVTKRYISKKLGYSTTRYFKNFLKRLKKHNLIDEKEFGGINYIIINPAYARKNMIINPTIYKMFKDDLDKCLTKYQISYLNMLPDGVDLDDMIRLEDR